MNEDKRHLLLIFIFLIVIYFITSIPFSRKCKLTGDEPHYMLMSYSIIHDRDLDLENNYRNRDFSIYCLYNELTPQLAIRNRGGHWYSRHNIGLPILITPFFWLGEKFHSERCLCLLAMSICISLTACNIFSICRKYIDNGKLCFFIVISINLLTRASERKG